jgi:diadenosine tetraphosphate (Ap4A) HIT family hydrolase
MPCAFCTPPEDPLYADDRCFVILHEDWAVLGHAMVVWRRHVENVSDLDERDALHLMKVYRRAERVLLEVTGAERAVIMKLGIQTPHLHLHLYPVRAALGRQAVMAIIDAKARVPFDEAFVRQVKERMDLTLRPE